MSVTILKPGRKPKYWAANRNEVVPEYRKFWDELWAAYPLWERGGGTAHNIPTNTSHGTLQATAGDGPDWVPGGLQFTAANNDAVSLALNENEFNFERLAPWTICTMYTVKNSTSTQALFAKYNNSSPWDRTLLFRQTTDNKLNVYLDGTSRITTSAFAAIGQRLLVFLTNDGTGAAGGLRINAYDLNTGGGLVVTGTGQHASDETSLGGSYYIGARGTNGDADNSSNLHEHLFIVRRALSIAEELSLVINPSGMFTCEERIWVPVVGATVHSGQCSMTASGTLTSAATAIRPASSSMTGSGSLTAAASAIRPAASAMTGSGTLTSAATAIRSASCSMTASGSVTSAAAAIRPGASAMTGSGVVTAAAAAIRPAVVSMTGTGTLTSSASIVSTIMSGVCSMTASGTLTVASTAIRTAVVAMTGTSTLTVVSAAIRPAVVSMTATGVLTAAADVYQQAQGLDVVTTGTVRYHIINTSKPRYSLNKSGNPRYGVAA